MRRWFALSLLLFAGGSISLGFGLAAQEHPPSPTHDLGSIRRSTAASPSRAREPVANRRSVLEVGLARSVPIALDIPAIDVAAPLTSLGLNPDGTVQSLNGYDQITSTNPLGRLIDPRYFTFGFRVLF